MHTALLSENKQPSVMQLQPGADQEFWDRFRELLDDQNDWPVTYTFKFIAPSRRLNQLKGIFDGHPLRVRDSRDGNYSSVTARVQMKSSEAVVDIYKQAALVEGVISL